MTDETVYWDRDDELDRYDLKRELEGLLANLLEWAGLDVTGGEQYQGDTYFDPDERDRRSLKLVDCPLSEIESEYAAQAMLKRVDAAREQFDREIESSVMQLADDLRGVASDALDKWRKR